MFFRKKKVHNNYKVNENSSCRVVFKGILTEKYLRYFLIVL